MKKEVCVKHVSIFFFLIGGYLMCCVAVGHRLSSSKFQKLFFALAAM